LPAAYICFTGRDHGDNSESNPPHEPEKVNVTTPRTRRALVAGTTTLLALFIGFTATSVAQPSSAQAASTTAAASADDAMPSAVETFEYPGAAKILKEKGIALHQGDGHILLTDCSAPHDITVKAKPLTNYCFAVKGKQGHLVLELADAYGIWTEDHPVQAKITMAGESTAIDAPRNDYTPFGEGKDPTKRAVLLELNVTG
jgi:hypothetical protein